METHDHQKVMPAVNSWKRSPLGHFVEEGMWEEPYPGSMFTEEGSLWKEVCRGFSP
jgi:hypothetical protein